MRVHRWMGAAVAAPLLAAGLVGCTDFLTSGKTKNNPNSPTAANIDQLFVGVEVGTFAFQEGYVPEIFCLFVQQCFGRQRFQETNYFYGIAPTDNTIDWALVYSGGGLIDERTIQSLATERGDLVYKGIAEVYEALTIGTAADVWGDIPYREALSTQQPKYDPQLQVYADVQALLDQAITDLTGAGPGPGSFDLVYGGDVTKWTELAHTLKARFYLNTAEIDPSVYANVLTQAQLGISTPANDFVGVHSGSSTGSRNLWFQYSLSSFGADLQANQQFVDLIISQNGANDPRLDEYFDASRQQLQGSRNRVDFPQPIVTYAENQLMIAEAQVRLGQSGQAAFDAERAAEGVPTQTATLDNILLEKYIALFQTIQVFNDWKRTCVPAIEPVTDELISETTAGNLIVPRRVYYSDDEFNANPEHTPDATEQAVRGGIGKDNPGDLGGFRNPNDPSDPPGCPSPPIE